MLNKLSKSVPTLLTLLLLVLLAYQCARLFWNIAAPKNTITLAELPTATNMPQTLFSNITLTASTNKNSTPTSTSAATQDWQLKGTYLEDNNDPIAIIQTPQGSVVVETNEVVKNNVTVKSIKENHVILNDAGQSVTLWLNRSNLNDISDNTLGVAPSTASPQPPSSQKAPALSVFLSMPTTLLNHLSIEPEHYLGQTAYRVTIKNGSRKGVAILRQMNLQPGDLVISINDQAITPETVQQLLNSKEKLQKISAKIERNDTIQTILLN